MKLIHGRKMNGMYFYTWKGNRAKHLLHREGIRRIIKIEARRINGIRTDY
jgi:hypothetical protein